MDIKEKIYDIIDEFDNCDIDECVEAIDKFLDENPNVKSFKIYEDDDVFDSCGLSIYYISVSWVDFYGNLDICGAKIEHY